MKAIKKISYAFLLSITLHVLRLHSTLAYLHPLKSVSFEVSQSQFEVSQSHFEVSFIAENLALVLYIGQK